MTVHIDLFGKVAVVTGGNGDIGSAIVARLVEAGAKCFVVDKPSSKNRGIKTRSKHIEEIPVDFFEPNPISYICELLKEKAERVDILVNSAGVTYSKKLELYDKDSWNKTLHINLTIPFELAQQMTSGLMNNGGSIINITSLAAEQGFPCNVAYVASKGALKQLTKGLALDLADKEIRVNAVGPGYIKTKMTLGSWSSEGDRLARSNRMIAQRWGTTSDVADVVLFLSSDLSKYINGQSIYVDGGWLAKGL